jgi:uncharacterized protein YjbJ (UPF0337 family)
VFVPFVEINSRHRLTRRGRGNTLMNREQARGKWDQLKGEIKKKWARMTDDDLLEAEGDMDKLAGKIQERTGDKKEEIRRWLDTRNP